MNYMAKDGNQTWDKAFLPSHSSNSGIPDTSFALRLSIQLSCSLNDQLRVDVEKRQCSWTVWMLLRPSSSPESPSTELPLIWAGLVLPWHHQKYGYLRSLCSKQSASIPSQVDSVDFAVHSYSGPTSIHTSHWFPRSVFQQPTSSQFAGELVFYITPLMSSLLSCNHCQVSIHLRPLDPALTMCTT